MTDETTNVDGWYTLFNVPDRSRLEWCMAEVNQQERIGKHIVSVIHRTIVPEVNSRMKRAVYIRARDELKKQEDVLQRISDILSSVHNRCKLYLDDVVGRGTRSYRQLLRDCNKTVESESRKLGIRYRFVVQLLDNLPDQTVPILPKPESQAHIIPPLMVPVTGINPQNSLPNLGTQATPLFNSLVPIPPAPPTLPPLALSHPQPSTMR